MNHDGLLAPARLAAYAAGVAVALESSMSIPLVSESSGPVLAVLADRQIRDRFEISAFGKVA